MEFVVIAKCVLIVRLEQRTLLGLTFLVEVAVSNCHKTRVEGLEGSAASASWIRYLSLVSVQCLHLS